MTKFYPKVDQEVFIKSRKKKGIVKFINPDAYRTKVTYYDKDDNRKTLWFSNGSLAPWNKNKKNNIQKNKEMAELLFGKSNLNTHPNLPTSHVPGLVTTPVEIEEIKINPLKTSFEQVREFQKAFDLPAPDTPTILTETQVVNRSAWLIEEVVELMWATAENAEQFATMFVEVLRQMEASFHKLLEKPFEPENKLINQVDANIDSKYFVDGNLVEQGIVPDPITTIVHAANMAKLHDGVVVRNEVGKVMKPEGWEAPEEKIAVEVERQIRLGAKRFENKENTYS